MRRVKNVVKKLIGYEKYYDNKMRAEDSEYDTAYSDVLFINGCYLPHPSRYRCEHQKEQLLASGIVSDEVFYTDIDLDAVRRYRAFVFFRCPYTDKVGEFIKLAKSLNKLVIFDIDDLLFDVSYTKSIKHIDTLTEEQKREYYNGIELTQQTLKLCDMAITTTERLAEELGKYVDKVYINRNVASEKMVELSEAALKEKTSDDSKVILGYFSGSITHNQDFDLILPTLIEVLEERENVYLSIVGELSLPKELEQFKDRIIVNPFVEWEKLPQLISSVDVNLAPLDNTIFNEAKSENKWVEAALVKVPTIASKVGAFEKMIQHDVTGVLCSTEDEWKQSLLELIDNAEYRNKIANSAYQYVKENCTSVASCATIHEILKENLKPNFIFVIPVLQISGGALVTLKHCALLKKNGFDVTIFNEGDELDKWVTKDGEQIPVFNIKKHPVYATLLDNVIGTLWTTMDFVGSYPKISNRFYLVQNFETNFYEEGNFFKFRANQSYFLTDSVKYITISKWCEDWLVNKFHRKVEYAPNGIDCDSFYPVERKFDGRKIRIIVEGNSDDYYKNVDESFKIIDMLDKDKYEIWYMSYQGKPKDIYHVDKFMHKVPYDKVPDVYRECDILIKSSVLESFSYPPLEMMSTGGYVVVAPNGGNIEYLVDGENCLFYDHDDLNTAVAAIEKIRDDAELRRKLYEKGIETAKSRDWGNIAKDIINLYV